MLPVIEYFIKLFMVIQNNTIEYGICKSLLIVRCNCVCIAQHRAARNGHSNMVRCASLECCNTQTPAMSITNLPRSTGTVFITYDICTIGNMR